jgi:hypothetical protein
VTLSRRIFEATPMSRFAEIVLSSSPAKADLAELIPSLINLTGADEDFLAFRTVGTSHAFAKYTAFLNGETADQLEDYILLGSDLKIESIQQHYRNDACLMVDLSNCPLAESLDSAIARAIPATEVGDFSVSRVELRIGDHDVFDVNAMDEVSFIGRFSVSLVCKSDGTPSSPETVQNAILELAEFRQVVFQVESVCGPTSVSFLYIY